MTPSVILEVPAADAQTVLSVLRRGQRTYGKGSRGHDACKDVADRLEAVMLTREKKHE